MTMKITPHPNVAQRYILNLPNSFRRSDAQAITIVTLEAIRTKVLTVASGTFSLSAPCGQ